MIRRLLIILFAGLLQACTTLEGPPNPDDPFESYNRSMFAFNESVDKYALKPLAKGYKAITPTAVDSGITNFFSNIDDILVIFNDLFQLKFTQAARDLSRFVYNTTFGLAGFIDVATGFGLPKNNEDFGQTLGYWGLEAGPYIVLPIVGPSNVRDAIGFAVDVTQLDPVFQQIDNEKTQWGVATLKYVDIRADLLSTTNIIDETAPDKYALIREAWRQRRQNLVYDGDPPDEFDEEGLFEDDLFKDDIVR
jgi:phospholipid-binding lipoprotein MlaA